jgi:hypothetical protein
MHLEANNSKSVFSKTCSHQWMKNALEAWQVK